MVRSLSQPGGGVVTDICLRKPFEALRGLARYFGYLPPLSVSDDPKFVSLASRAGLHCRTAVRTSIIICHILFAYGQFSGAWQKSEMDRLHGAGLFKVNVDAQVQLAIGGLLWNVVQSFRPETCPDTDYCDMDFSSTVDSKKSAHSKENNVTDPACLVIDCGEARFVETLFEYSYLYSVRELWNSNRTRLADGTTRETVCDSDGSPLLPAGAQIIHPGRLSALVILGASFIWPHVKLLYLSKFFFQPTTDSFRRNGNYWLAFFGKWSFTDVLILIAMVGVLDIGVAAPISSEAVSPYLPYGPLGWSLGLLSTVQGFIHAEIFIEGQLGMYSFCCAVVMSLCIGVFIECVDELFRDYPTGAITRRQSRLLLERFSLLPSRSVSRASAPGAGIGYSHGAPAIRRMPPRLPQRSSPAVSANSSRSMSRKNSCLSSESVSRALSSNVVSPRNGPYGGPFAPPPLGLSSEQVSDVGPLPDFRGVNENDTTQSTTSHPNQTRWNSRSQTFSAGNILSADTRHSNSRSVSFSSLPSPSRVDTANDPGVTIPTSLAHILGGGFPLSSNTYQDDVLESFPDSANIGKSGSPSRSYPTRGNASPESPPPSPPRWVENSLPYTTLHQHQGRGDSWVKDGLRTTSFDDDEQELTDVLSQHSTRDELARRNVLNLSKEKLSDRWNRHEFRYLVHTTNFGLLNQRIQGRWDIACILPEAGLHILLLVSSLYALARALTRPIVSRHVTGSFTHVFKTHDEVRLSEDQVGSSNPSELLGVNVEYSLLDLGRLAAKSGGLDYFLAATYFVFVVIGPTLRIVSQLCTLLWQVELTKLQWLHAVSRHISVFYALEVMILVMPLIDSTISDLASSMLTPRNVPICAQLNKQHGGPCLELEIELLEGYRYLCATVALYLVSGFDGSFTHKRLHFWMHPDDRPPPDFSCIFPGAVDARMESRVGGISGHSAVARRRSLWGGEGVGGYHELQEESLRV